MIFGNPHELAVWADVVREWQSNFTEGIFMLCIDGRYLSGHIMQSTTLCVERGFLEDAVKMLDTEVHLANNRDKTELFNSAHIPRYVGYDEDDEQVENVEVILQRIRDHGWSAYKDIKYEGVEITPMQIGDYGWTVYHFVDYEEEVLVYKHTDSEEIHEKRMPLGTTRAVFLEAAEKMKIFDAPPADQTNQP